MGVIPTRRIAYTVSSPIFIGELSASQPRAEGRRGFHLFSFERNCIHCICFDLLERDTQEEVTQSTYQDVRRESHISMNDAERTISPDDIYQTVGNSLKCIRTTEHLQWKCGNANGNGSHGCSVENIHITRKWKMKM